MSEELVKRLRAQAVYMPEKFSKNAELLDVLMKAADAIEELQAAEKKYLANISALETENQHLKRERYWIPVTERLPEAGERVLCYCRANIYEVMKMRTDGAWVHNDKVYDSAYMSGFVTHWMPLPQPPKEE